MYCRYCGELLPDPHAPCPACRAQRIEPRVVAPPREAGDLAPPENRVFAFFIDLLLVGAAMILLGGGLVMLGFVQGSLINSFFSWDGSGKFAGFQWDGPKALTTGMFTVAQFALGLLIASFYWLYAAVMESSRYQATLGKQLFGLRVMDAQGARISFWRALVRGIVKSLSREVFVLNTILLFVTPYRQGGHDLVCSTFVLKAHPRTSPEVHPAHPLLAQ